MELCSGGRAKTIWTVGHSNRSLQDLLQILSTVPVANLVDVRRFPSSRRHPHFSGRAVAAALTEAGITYHHLPHLGGLRRERMPNSPNAAWRTEGFNAYADYMQTPEFQRALDELETLAATGPTAFMCAEALPWRCHRRLIADALVVRGWRVLHLLGPIRVTQHFLPPFAVCQDGLVVYPQETLFT